MSLLLLGVGSQAVGSLVVDLVWVPAALAYSLRKLRSAYAGSAIRVRRSSDNAELDIGFSSNELDTTALLAHCGAGNGFVVTWYDQSGNARNITQATAGNQPQIVSSGAVLTQNGKPTTNYTPGQDFTAASYTLTFATGNHVARIADTAGTYQVIRQQNTTSGNLWFMRYNAGSPTLLANTITFSGGAPGTALHVMSGTSSEAGNSRIYINGASTATGAIMTPGATVGLMRVAQSPVGGQGFSGSISEILLFGSILTTTQRDTLEGNQSAFYGIPF